MAAISDADWGRIYAFIWKKHKEGHSTNYREMFEKDPKAAIAAIDSALKAEGHPGLGKYDTLFDIGPRPADVTNAQLDEIIEGKAVAFLRMRLTC